MSEKYAFDMRINVMNALGKAYYTFKLRINVMNTLGKAYYTLICALML